MTSIDKVIRDIDVSLFEKRFEEITEQIQTEEDIKTDLEYVLRFIPPPEIAKTKKIISKNVEVMIDVITGYYNIPSSDHYTIGCLLRNHTDVYLEAVANLIEEDRQKGKFFDYKVFQLNQDQILRMISKEKGLKVFLLERI